MDIVVGTYRNVSIKVGEKESRGRSDKVIIKSTKSKIPKEFQAFLRNGENKNWLIYLLCETISSSQYGALAILQASVIYISKEQLCTRE